MLSAGRIFLWHDLLMFFSGVKLFWAITNGKKRRKSYYGKVSVGSIRIESLFVTRACAKKNCTFFVADREGSGKTATFYAPFLLLFFSLLQLVASNGGQFFFSYPAIFCLSKIRRCPTRTRRPHPRNKPFFRLSPNVCSCISKINRVTFTKKRDKEIKSKTTVSNKRRTPTDAGFQDRTDWLFAFASSTDSKPGAAKG